MALGLYSLPDASAQLDVLQPFTVTFDGRLGGAQDRLVYIRNDNSTRWYSAIQIAVIDDTDTNLTDNSVGGWIWKLMTKDIVPTEDEWQLISPATTLDITSNLGSDVVGDIITFLPVWIRVQIPRGQEVAVIRDIILRLTSTEGLV